MFPRQIDASLVNWVNKVERKPLLMRGPRRVGKTTTLRHLADVSFQKQLYVNFEEQPEYARCFEPLESAQIIARLEELTQQHIEQGKTLLVLDEIHACPNALQRLNEFAVQQPQLHVVAAGVLVDVVLEELGLTEPELFSEAYYLQPLNFGEFLRATEQKDLEHFLARMELQQPHPSVISAMKRSLHAYLTVGGMPEAVAAYGRGVSPWELKQYHQQILTMMQADFKSLASTRSRKYLHELFREAPQLVGRACKYSQINAEMQSRDLKKALEKLWQVGCVYPVYHLEQNSRQTQVNAKKFQLLFADSGLMGRACNSRASQALNQLFSLEGREPALQFVGQQLMASLPPQSRPQVFFWVRQARNSSARVDFLTQLGSWMLPVVVRSGKRGTLKSLDIYLKEHPQTPFAIRFSEDELDFEDRVLSLPLFLASYWQQFANQILAQNYNFTAGI